MKRIRPKIRRPGTLSELSKRSKSLEEFGYNLRDWQHEIRDKWRGKSDFYRRISKEPEFLQNKFKEGDIADAYLAAYTLWLCDKVGVPRVRWAKGFQRIAKYPWFSDYKRASLLRNSPAHFIEKNLFTIPDSSFLDKRLKEGRNGTGKNLSRDVREQSGLTQTEFAKKLGVGVGTVHNWEQGRNQPKGTAATLLILLDRQPGLISKL